MTATTAAQTEAPKIQKFEEMLDLEFDGQKVLPSAAFQLAGVSPYRMGQMHVADERAKAAAKSAQVALFAAMDTLTPEEVIAYGAYRTRVREERKNYQR